MIHAFHFGPDDDAPLFGVYHAPPPAAAPKCGFLFCYPMGHEYILAHRAFVQLGARLAEKGSAVLRFDYHGCGDSAGDANEGSVERWLDNTRTAIEELRARSGSSVLCLVGCRLGATLAATVAAEDREIDGLVLWDPLVLGRPYVEELRAQHRAMLRDSHVRPGAPEAGEPAEALGFPLHLALERELEQIDLRNGTSRPAVRALLLETRASPGIEDLNALLRRTGVALEHREIPTPDAWSWRENVDKVMVPHAVLQAILAWLEHEYG